MVKLKTRESKTRPQKTKSSPKPCPDASPETPSADDGKGAGILVNHSIHHGVYPVVGLSVAGARRVLSTMMNLDPNSAAVIAGEIIEDEDERVILENDEMLSFVKRSSVKG